MFKVKLLLIVMVVAMLATGIVTAQGSSWGGGGRAASTHAAKFLKQCRTQSTVSFVISSGC